MRYWHLAQINVAQALGPAGSEVMADFQAQIPAINALADATPGFVWRLQDASGNATAIRAFDDPLVLINISVWESVEALKGFVYRSGHADVSRDRQKWFEKPAVAHQALWWIPAGHIPTIEEASSRLERLRSAQPTRFAFTFAHVFAAPDQPAEPTTGPAPQLYDGRKLQVVSNTASGDVVEGQVFEYRQADARVWSVYHTEETRFGSLVASADAEGKLDIRYQQLDPRGTPRTGRCVTTPEVMSDGRLRLHESWQWINGDGSRGQTVLEEIAAAAK
jgi:Domain of unknown function (DUF3291)